MKWYADSQIQDQLFPKVLNIYLSLILVVGTCPSCVRLNELGRRIYPDPF